MKRTLKNLLLLLVVAVTGISSFISCKDYDSDAVSDLKGQLKDVIAKQNSTIGGISGSVSELIKNSVSDSIKANNVTIINTIETAKNEAVDAAKNAAESLNTATLDSLQKINADLTQKISNLEAALSGYVTKDELNGYATKDDLNGYVKNDELNAYVKKDDLKDYTTKKEFNDLSNKLAEANRNYSTLTEKAKQMSDSIAHVWVLAHADSIRISNLTDSINAHRADITSNTAAINEIKSQILAINNTQLKNLQDSVQNHWTAIVNINKGIEELKNKVAGAQQTADNALDSVAKLRTDFNKSINAAISIAKTEILNEIADKYYTKNEIEALGYVTAAQVQNTYATKTALNDSIEALETRLTALINTLSDRINKLVTGIIIQAAENPVTGYFNTPADVQLNLLAAYHGTAVNGFVFPNAPKANYVGEYYHYANLDGVETVQAAKGETLIDDDDDNAGTLYFTINPTNVDFSGVTVSLVDSRDEAAPGFGPLTIQKSDRLLSFGGTRAAKNGFYEAKVKVVDVEKARYGIDKSALKSTAQNIINKLRQPSSSRLNIAEIATTLYNQFNNKLTAYGLKATWNDNGKENAVYSQYKVAATSVNLLSYNTFYNNGDGLNFHIQRIPTLESKGFVFDHFDPIKIDGMVDSLESTVSLEIPDVDNITIDGKDIKIKASIDGSPSIKGDPTITIDTVKGYVYYMRYDPETRKEYKDSVEYTKLNGVKVSTDGLTVDLEGVNVKVDDVDFSNVKFTVGKKTQEFKVKVSLKQFNDVVEQLNDKIAGMMTSVNDIINKVNSTAKTIDSQYINRINNLLGNMEKAVKNANAFLQPVMLYNGTGSADHMISQEKLAPSVFKGTGAIVLHPTSMTAELLAPAYKKFVQVTSGPSASAVAYANKGTNMNKVIDGDIHSVAFQANEKGVYEITYSAVDYSGYVVVKHFYVKVK